MDVTGQKQFETEVLKSNVPVLVDFWATWCPPCKIYSPVIEEVAKENEKRLKLVKIDVDDNEDLASHYGVSSIPTTLIIEKGKVKASFVGAIPKDKLRAWLKENL